MPILYDFPKAPSPRRARILLAEKGIAHETVIIDMTRSEQLGDAYRTINPDCTLPAFRLDDGTVVHANLLQLLGKANAQGYSRDWWVVNLVEL